MKNLLKCSSLIRVAVVIVLMAFMASQMTDTYARGYSNYGFKKLIKKIHACNSPDCEQCNPDGDNDKVKKVEVTNWEENPCCETQSSNIPQAIQQEYSAVTFLQSGAEVLSTEAGRYTVPSGKRLIVELITLNVQDKFFEKQAFYLFATTSIGADTVKHPIGTVFSGFGDASSNKLSVPIAGVMGSFIQTIYADQGTDIIFTVVTHIQSPGVPFQVTFSGRLIDVP